MNRACVAIATLLYLTPGGLAGCSNGMSSQSPGPVESSVEEQIGTLEIRANGEDFVRCEFRKLWPE
jgi:hypothetical protein